MAKETKPATPVATPATWGKHLGISKPEHAAVCAVGGWNLLTLAIHDEGTIYESREVVGQANEYITEAEYKAALKKWREGVA